MIVCKGARELERMREANRLVSRTLDHLGTMINPGVTTRQLDAAAEDMILGAEPGRPSRATGDSPPASAPPSTIRSSTGFPTTSLSKGRYPVFDVGVYYKGFYGDSAWTFCVGEVSPELRKLLDVTRESLYRGIEQVVVGNRISDISTAYRSTWKPTGFGGERIRGPWDRQVPARGTAGPQLW